MFCLMLAHDHFNPKHNMITNRCVFLLDFYIYSINQSHRSSMIDWTINSKWNIHSFIVYMFNLGKKEQIFCFQLIAYRFCFGKLRKTTTLNNKVKSRINFSSSFFCGYDDQQHYLIPLFLVCVWWLSLIIDYWQVFFVKQKTKKNDDYLPLDSIVVFFSVCLGVFLEKNMTNSKWVNLIRFIRVGEPVTDNFLFSVFLSLSLSLSSLVHSFFYYSKIRWTKEFLWWLTKSKTMRPFRKKTIQTNKKLSLWWWWS